MDYQNAEFYKLNKNNPDLVYNFADERITYRKEEDENGNLQIVEYHKKDGRKGKKATTRRVVPPYEMSVEDFDIWKKKFVDDALEQRRHDDRTTRNNISIENLLETDLVCVESVENEYLRLEEERQAPPKTIEAALDILKVLTPTQKNRYLQVKLHGKTVREVADEEGCGFQRVAKSIAQAQEKIDKERTKRGY